MSTLVEEKEEIKKSPKIKVKKVRVPKREWVSVLNGDFFSVSSKCLASLRLILITNVLIIIM